MTKPIITIIGLGLTGTSIGLGLQRGENNFELVGHDKEHSAVQTARKLNAVHRSEWNLHAACAGADLIVLAVPLGELNDLFTHIREDLKPTCLVFPLVNVMQPAIAVAAEQLASHSHFVVGHPVLAGVGGLLSPRADLFEEVVFGLAAGAQTDPAAIQLASDFVERLGAKPLFVDAQEHDGIIAGVEQLSQVMAAALMQTNTTAPGWREARRLAGRPFAQATELGHSAEHLFSAFQSNRANLLQRLDQLQQVLADWRDLLALDAPTDDKHPLRVALAQVENDRAEWEAQAMLKRWEDLPVPTTTESHGMLRQMFFGNLMGKGNKK